MSGSEFVSLMKLNPHCEGVIVTFSENFVCPFFTEIYVEVPHNLTIITVLDIPYNSL